jgi:hypothetical protein
MDKEELLFLRVALEGDDFSDDIIAGLRQALSELEKMQRENAELKRRIDDTTTATRKA